MSLASISEEVQCIAFFLHSTTILKASIAACTTLHLYYTVLNLDEEVEYIWSKKWTVGKAMYLLTRYLGLSFLISAIVGFSDYHWQDAPYLIHYLLGEVPTTEFFETCFHGQLFAVAGPMIILPAGVILQLRVYALYGRKKIMLIFFILLNVAFSIFNFLPLAVPTLFSKAGSSPMNRCFKKRSLVRRGFLPRSVDASTCISAVGISGIGWGVAAFVELVLFIMVVCKAQLWRIWSRNNRTYSSGRSRHDITTTLARDSVCCFAILFTIFTIATICASFARSTEPRIIDLIFSESNALEVIVITIMSILAPRLILNLRAAYYGRIEGDSDETDLSWNLTWPGGPTSVAGQEVSSRSNALAPYLD